MLDEGVVKTLFSLSVAAARAPRDRTSMRQQRGAIAVMAAIGLSVAVILLSSIDIGYLFYEKRDLQKIADLAALAGATKLTGSTCTSTAADAAILTATQNAKVNANVAQTDAFPGTLTITCGFWATDTGNGIYTSYVAGQAKQNAVRVEVLENVVSFFGLLPQDVRAVAIATKDGDPIAAFSVGSKLLQINGGVVPGLLAKLGLNLSGTSLLSYNGLANVTVKPGGLLQALGFPIALDADVATIKSVVALGTAGCGANSCPLQSVIGAIGTVGGQQNLVSALGLQAGQLNLPVKLLTDANGRGVFTIVDAANGKSALDLDINALELLTASIGVANSAHAVDAGLSLPGITAKVGIVEPPSIAIGGVGATAYTAQVRLFANISTSAIPAIGAITTGLLGTTVDLPLAIDVVDSRGTLTDLCTTKDGAGNDQATIAVTSSILKMCVGNIDPNAIFSQKQDCSYNLQDKQLLKVLNGLLTVNTHFTIDALTGGGNLTLIKGQSGQTGTALALGTTLTAAVNNLMKALTGAILGNILSPTGSATVNTANKDNLASGLLTAVNTGSTDTLKFIKAATTDLQAFVNGLGNDVKNLIGNALGLSVLGLLNNVGSVVGGLVSALGSLLGNLIGPCGLIGHDSQTCVANSLSGSQGSGGNAVSNVLLTLLGLVVQLLQPILDTLGNSLATLLDTLLGIKLGLTDVTLLDLNCKGNGVKLVQ